ncbi:hypothetical protein FGM00_17745 [Aggregatimonas sangjinii]|uniref:Uncharacterized protein n=1 Tax=Aggregatimonas sangjinii TaxID=2583587 RepID=A0A5B7SXR1_9FLAO|nr:hypothetical protein [Aggregatimonas sangjinii]QCX01868.1 hypothetical protein FGM00_17745 [Aggregatimonas sangjinii]
MSANTPSSKNTASDEIDLGQLLQLLKRGFHQLGNVFLRIFLFFKKYALILIGLAALGVAISFGLNQIISKKLKTEVIVRPNFDSKDYLYDVVNELTANIKAENENFFKSIGVELEDLKGFEIEIEPIEDVVKEDEDEVMNQMRYLEALSNFKEQSYVVDIIKSELAEKSVVNHKITFLYTNELTGPEISRKLLKLINTNDYLEEFREISVSNAASRIEDNTKLIIQIDDLVANYSKSLTNESSKPGTGTLYFEKENALNVPSLLTLKNNLIKEVEEKKLELKQQANIISIINLGNTQVVRKSLFNNRMFTIPMVLVLGFLLFIFLRYLDRKAKEIA